MEKQVQLKDSGKIVFLVCRSTKNSRVRDSEGNSFLVPTSYISEILLNPPEVTLLEKAHQQANQAYHEDGTTPISDAAFDALEAEIQKKDPTFEGLTKTGAAPMGNWPKVPHNIPMTSLNKALNPAEIQSWWDKTERELSRH